MAITIFAYPDHLHEADVFRDSIFSGVHQCSECGIGPVPKKELLVHFWDVNETDQDRVGLHDRTYSMRPSWHNHATAR